MRTVPSGHVDLLLLAIASDGPIHGYAIVEELRRRSEGAFALPEGTVYPSLYRLERQGMLRSRMRTVDGRSRRIYEVTPAGRQAAAERQESWWRLVASTASVLRGRPA